MSATVAMVAVIAICGDITTVKNNEKVFRGMRSQKTYTGFFDQVAIAVAPVGTVCGNETDTIQIKVAVMRQNLFFGQTNDVCLVVFGAAGKRQCE